MSFSDFAIPSQKDLQILDSVAAFNFPTNSANSAEWFQILSFASVFSQNINRCTKYSRQGNFKHMKQWWIDIHFGDFIRPTIVKDIFLHAIIKKLLRQVVWHVNIVMTWYKWCINAAIIAKFNLIIQRISAWIIWLGGLCADWNLPNSATKKKILLRRNSAGKRHLCLWG